MVSWKILLAEDEALMAQMMVDMLAELPVEVTVSLPCLTPLAAISSSAILFTRADWPRTTRTSRQLWWSRCTCTAEMIISWQSCWRSVRLSCRCDL